MLTFDNALTTDAAGNQRGKRFETPVRVPYRVRDSAGNFTEGFRTYDSTGAFLVGELERLDQELHEPLADVTWSRDMPLREDVTIADEVSSFTLSTYASAGGLGIGNGIGNGKAWIGKTSDQITGVGVDIGKIPHPLNPWAMEVKFTILELESAAKAGRPIDQQKFDGLQLKHQMDIDEQVYYGDTPTGAYGLLELNNAAANTGQVTNVTNVATGAAGYTTWAQKSPDEQLADVNEILTSVWATSAWAVMPSRLGIPPAQYGLISTEKVSQAGSISVLKYLMENNVVNASGRGKLEIVPMKWCIGAGVGGTIGTVGTDRMIAYTPDKKRVRFPMTLLNRTPVQFEGMYHKTTYYCRLGQVECVYPETVGYRDGI